MLRGYIKVNSALRMDMKFIAQELVRDHVSALSGFIRAGGPSWASSYGPAGCSPASQLPLGWAVMVSYCQCPFRMVWTHRFRSFLYAVWIMEYSACRFFLAVRVGGGVDRDLCRGAVPGGFTASAWRS